MLVPSSNSLEPTSHHHPIFPIISSQCFPSISSYSRISLVWVYINLSLPCWLFLLPVSPTHSTQAIPFLEHYYSDGFASQNSSESSVACLPKFFCNGFSALCAKGTCSPTNSPQFVAYPTGPQHCEPGFASAQSQPGKPTGCALCALQFSKLSLHTHFPDSLNALYRAFSPFFSQNSRL